MQFLTFMAENGANNTWWGMLGRRLPPGMALQGGAHFFAAQRPTSLTQAGDSSMKPNIYSTKRVPE
jgi:hypothetical protein